MFLIGQRGRVGLTHWDAERRWRKEGEGWVLGAWERHIRGELSRAEDGT